MTGERALPRPGARGNGAQRDVFLVRFGHDVSADMVENFLAHVATAMSSRADVVVETSVTGRRYEHRLRLPAVSSREILAQLRVALPVRIEPGEPDCSQVAAGVELRLVGGDGLLRRVDAAATSRSLLASLRPATNERVWLQWVLRSGGLGSGEPSWGRLVDAQWRQLVGHRRVVDQKVVRAKSESLQVACSLRVGASANSAARAAHLVRGVVSAFGQTRSSATYLTASVVSAPGLSKRLVDAQPPSRTTAFRLTPSELAPILGWPIANPVVPGLQLGTSRHLAPAESILSKGIVLGRATMPGAERDLALSPALICQHVAVSAPTGTGKSTLLAGMALQAVARGLGTVLVDWKGDTADAFLDRLAPTDERHIVVLGSRQRDAVVGLPNPLTAPLVDRDRLVDQLIGLLLRLWDLGDAPRTVPLLQTAIFTLARAGGTALVDLPELLTNRAFRHAVLGRITDRTGIEGYWANFEAMSEAERAQVIAPTLNRTRPWLLRRDVRHLLGQVESTWEMDEILNGGVLVVKLARGVLGDEVAELVGSMVVGQIMGAMLRRARVKEHQRRPAVVLLDEFQHMLGASRGFADDLVAARGLGVGFVMAHQHLGQLTPELRESVLANARTRVAFQMQAGDAAVLARDLGVSPGDLQHLSAYEALARIATPAGVSSCVSLRTLPLHPPSGAGGSVRRTAQARFAVQRDEIDRQMAERYRGDSSDADKPIGRRRRSS